MDPVLLQFFQWVTTYSGVLQNLWGNDRENAVAAIDDDERFDAWMRAYERKQKAQAAKMK